jgi:hypothetical protein
LKEDKTIYPRRAFIKRLAGISIGIIAGAILISILFYNEIASIIRRVFYRFIKPATLLADNERSEMAFPPEGKDISVELALNSRCTSDYDDDPKYFHWGMFDREKRLSNEQIRSIVDLVTIPRFTDIKIQVHIKENILTYLIDNNYSGIHKQWAMVESGMQQQATALVCAALGVGMAFQSYGSEKDVISGDSLTTTRIKLDAMKPSYDSSYWSKTHPSDWKPWLKGNLSDPVRDGQQSLLKTLSSLETNHEGTNTISEQSLSQILWAARGRTPHYYKSQPWGMTIPTNRGEQNNTDIFVISKLRIEQYINWANNRPTHSLKETKQASSDSWNTITELLPSIEYCLVINRNEDAEKVYWETGYQLINILLQARALNISYRAVLLNENQIETLKTSGINNAVAVIGI